MNGSMNGHMATPNESTIDISTDTIDGEEVSRDVSGHEAGTRLGD